MELTKGYNSFNEAKAALNNYIIGYYNKVRSHRHNSGLAPNESEREHWKIYKLVAHII